MVDGFAYIATMMRYNLRFPLWGKRPGEHLLDCGCPWYDVYECRGGDYMAVGTLEPKFCRTITRPRYRGGPFTCPRGPDYLAGDENRFSARLP